VGAEGLLGKLEGLLGVLDGTGLQELNDSLLVGGHTADLSDDLSDQTDSLADGSLSLGRAGILGLFSSGLECGGGVALVLTDGDHLGMRFDHKII